MVFEFEVLGHLITLLLAWGRAKHGRGGCLFYVNQEAKRDEEACVPFLPSRAHFQPLNLPTLCPISQILPSSFRSAVGW
jgi:hypothetical protein